MKNKKRLTVILLTNLLLLVLALGVMTVRLPLVQGQPTHVHAQEAPPPEIIENDGKDDTVDNNNDTVDRTNLPEGPGATNTDELTREMPSDTVLCQQGQDCTSDLSKQPLNPSPNGDPNGDPADHPEQPTTTDPATTNGDPNGDPATTGERTTTVPSEAITVVEFAQSHDGAAQPGYVGSRTFANDGRGGGEVLPQTAADGSAIVYKEYDIHPRQKGVNRGAERVVLGSDGSSYYTSDHYRTFTSF